MKKLFVLALLPLLMAACKRDITSINVDPKNPQVAPGSAFFSNAQKNMADLLTSSNVNDNIFRLIVQYWQETTYLDESQYDIDTRQNPRQLWNAMYRDVMRDIREAKKLIPDQENNAAIRQNQLAIAEIQEIFTWYYLVTTFGDIPYSEALNIEILQPKYDKQQDIYNDLLSRLDAAIGQLDPSAGSFGTADLLYGGDVEAWRKFANSFKVKMGMTIADVDAARAKAAVESAVAAGVFTSNDDNALFQYLDAPPNTNPIWVDLVQSNRKDFVAATTIINKMLALGDPRINEFFTLDASGGFSGGKPGEGSNYATFSKPSGLERIFNPNTQAGRADEGRLTFPNFPANLLSYAEVEFFLAEAKERGFNVPGTAAEHYNNAITASILEWGGTTAEATAYLGKPAVAYSSANWKQKIGEQKWLALYNRGWDEWIEWRRLDFPVLQKATDAVTDIPIRFTYPVPEQNVNPTNYEAASASIGGDVVTTKLFWDVQ
jgi:hypothetical protein